MEILNSRSEYSRCRVPRLQIDQEAWKSRQKSGEEVREKSEVEDSQAKEAKKVEDEERNKV